jgi:G:T-mismatch repair DNA endonuclease (very short patch repair protein)
MQEKRALDPTFRLIPNQLDYWVVKHGLTLEEAKQKVKERQTTNSVEAFIRRAGGDVEAGTLLHMERQEKWLNSLEARGWFGNHSDVSRRLFEELQMRMTDELLFGDRELTVRGKDRYFKLDCTIAGTKKAIEFFGDYWHANPRKYADNHPIRRLDEGGFVTAQEIRARDAGRLQQLQDAGFDVLVVWEADYMDDPEGTVARCVAFLNTDHVAQASNRSNQGFVVAT